MSPPRKGADDRLSGPTAASALVHVLLLAAMLATVPHREGGQATSQPQVQMMFERSGSSGLAGPNTALPNEGREAAATPKPTSPPPPTGQETEEAQQATPDLVAPDAAAPSPLPETPSQQAMLQSAPKPQPQAAVPPAQPTPPKPAVRPSEKRSSSRPMRLRMRGTPAPSTSTSPFSHPMDLSFAPTSEHGASRPRHGSGRSVDLSLGPMVRNGQLNVPYASAGIRGVSDDYGELLQEWIQRHLYYPQAAADRGEDGVSGVHVSIDRSGHVLSIDATTRSGHEILDDATSGMFRNARLPPVPPDMIGPHFDIDLKIHYILVHQTG